MGMGYKCTARRGKAGMVAIFFAFFVTVVLPVNAQSYYVNRPDARILDHGNYSVGLHLAPNGGLLFGLKAGFFNRLQIGLSYGGERIIGSGPIRWYELPPGVQARVAILDEYTSFMSLAVGFDSQDPVGSVDLNQAGIYLAAGKEIPAGWFAFDLGLGAGYDILDENAFHLYAVTGVILGEAVTITPELTVYPQRDPNRDNILNLGVGVRWEIYAGTGAEFLLTDMLSGFDPGEEEGWTRSIRLQITQEF